MKIKIIVPVVSEYYNKIVLEDFARVVRPDTLLSVVSLKRGPERIEDIYDETFCVPFTLEEAKKAEEEGCNAVVFFCATDPGLSAAKELLNIPVVGMLESSMHLASQLGNKFSVVVPLKTSINAVIERARLYLLEDRLASVREVDTRVADLETNIESMKKKLVKVGKKCILDGADVLIFGCGGFRRLSNWLQDQLGIPVIEPGLVAVRTAEMLVDLRLAQSKRTSMKPVPKKIYLYESCK